MLSHQAADKRLGHVRNLAGVTSGTLVAETYVKTHKQGADDALQMALWDCRCSECGAVVRRARRYIVSGVARCDCQRKIRKDLSGKRFGRLTVIGLAPLRGGESLWIVRCRCGNQKELPRSSLMTGDTRSCGCLRRETAAANQARAARLRSRLATRRG